MYENDVWLQLQKVIYTFKRNIINIKTQKKCNNVKQKAVSREWKRFAHCIKWNSLQGEY